MAITCKYLVAKPALPTVRQKRRRIATLFIFGCCCVAAHAPALAEGDIQLPTADEVLKCHGYYMKLAMSGVEEAKDWSAFWAAAFDELYPDVDRDDMQHQISFLDGLQSRELTVEEWGLVLDECNSHASAIIASRSAEQD